MHEIRNDMFKNNESTPHTEGFSSLDILQFSEFQGLATQDTAQPRPTTESP